MVTNLGVVDSRYCCSLFVHKLTNGIIYVAGKIRSQGESVLFRLNW